MRKPKKMVYEWSGGYGFPVDAQVAGERLEMLRQRHGGLVTAEIVVEDSRPESAPLHNCFEWDNEVAAENYRKEQARLVIQNVRVIVAGADGDAPVRAFVNVRHGEARGYAATVGAMMDPAMREQVLQTAWRELESFRRRYEEFQELAAVLGAIDQTLQKKKAA